MEETAWTKWTSVAAVSLSISSGGPKPGTALYYNSLVGAQSQDFVAQANMYSVVASGIFARAILVDFEMAVLIKATAAARLKRVKMVW